MEQEGGGKVRGEDISWSSVQQYSQCTSLDPALYFKDLHNKNLIIYIRKIEKVGVRIFIEDKEEAVSRTIKSNLQVYSGATISLSKAMLTWNKKYILSFTQHKYSDRDTRDEAKRCSNYPTDQYRSYADCDLAFVRSRCHQLGFMPFWATENMSEVTRCLTGDLREKVGEVWGLFDGTTESDCHKPGRSTSVIGSELSAVCNTDNHSTLVFTFDKRIIIYDSDFPGFGWVTLFTDLGGSLGLWLGMGVAQVAEILLKTITKNNVS